MTDSGTFAWPPAPIPTERLVLRESEARDRAAFVELFASPEVGRHIGGARPRDELERAVPEVPGRRPGCFVVELDGTMIGLITLDPRDAERPGHVRPEAGETELGYLFLPEAWGRGYAFEACAAALDWLAGARPGEPVVLSTRSANDRAMRLAEKLGFTEVERFEEYGAEQWFGVRPSAEPDRTKGGTTSEIVLMSDPKVAAVPVVESGERLVDVRHDGRLLVDPRKQDPADAFAHLRAGVLQRLLTAQTMLPAGLRLLFVEGYRPPSLQREYFEEYAGQLRAARPEWTAEQVHSAASRYVSPPDIAPHSAGAAVDLTLADADGHELDLGTRMNADPEESAGACYTHAENISEEARANRKVLGTVLAAAGLVNYPTEWWHWSFGDRYWALIAGETAALYGPKELDSRS